MLISRYPPTTDISTFAWDISRSPRFSEYRSARFVQIPVTRRANSSSFTPVRKDARTSRRRVAKRHVKTGRFITFAVIAA
jgi:hypothetical protein